MTLPRSSQTKLLSPILTAHNEQKKFQKVCRNPVKDLRKTSIGHDSSSALEYQFSLIEVQLVQISMYH